MRCRRTLNCKVNAKSLILDIICANFLQPIYNTYITYGIDYMNTVCGRIILCEVVFFKKKIIIYLWWSREHTNWALGAKHGMLLFSRQTSLSFVWHGRNRHKWRTASCLYLKKQNKKTTGLYGWIRLNRWASNTAALQTAQPHLNVASVACAIAGLASHTRHSITTARYFDRCTVQ